jgi:hypothetical protein
VNPLLLHLGYLNVSGQIHVLVALAFRQEPSETRGKTVSKPQNRPGQRGENSSSYEDWKSTHSDVQFVASRFRGLATIKCPHTFQQKFPPRKFSIKIYKAKRKVSQ